ncbi:MULTISPECIES: LacI family DNA-binding transcriptional regulator [Metabacillus]|uniref:LacI family DNA-binding transcriptional regulator n=1 Tax=Metabacillus hrfriensis TaxID=3048891 RepID=A0ACD4RIC7_9BACI|nr:MULTISPECIES: LacI family DNA-binding transcriptional regulator [Metabacillus]UAL54352.1 LacI family DNA-binding transcriptional regulator [Metabacillus dongyingensis]USK30670.1 LacI family DNA-binding transcriptional regulator [Bacillus sp. CMF21]WHZ59920.1 LacI family DNA-binding transcriptional regulator [Metabacillus sp. CT-WN-B3]
MANIKDIAKMAGVSVTTVSRVINNHPYVSFEKREAVLRAIEVSKYEKNINAVHLSKGKTFLIGIAIPFSNHPFFALIVEGIANEALNNNYKLVLFQTNYEEFREIEALDMLKQKQIDALIICSRICQWDTIDAYLDYGPIIFCEDTRDKKVSSIFMDHYKSFSKALEYLHFKGHRKVGICVGRRTGFNGEQRILAYRDFLNKINEPFESEYIFSDCYDFENGEEIVQRLINMNNPPSALLVSNDQVAAGIVTCSKEKRISIPHELAIIGFDNQPIAKIMNITTIEIPLVEMGRKLFLRAINNKNISQEEISVKLVERLTV